MFYNQLKRKLGGVWRKQGREEKGYRQPQLYPFSQPTNQPIILPIEMPGTLCNNLPTRANLYDSAKCITIN